MNSRSPGLTWSPWCEVGGWHLPTVCGAVPTGPALDWGPQIQASLAAHGLLCFSAVSTRMSVSSP